MLFLLFHNHLRDTSALIKGRLLLIDSSDCKIAETYIATSGIPGFQEPDETNIRGRGSIPENSEAGIDRYTVATKPIYMPAVKGVEGNFFKIDPCTVTINGVQRGDFGIHADENAPGSAGCIVLTTGVGWAAFQKKMAQCAAQGLTGLPLLVSYAKN